MMFESLGIAKFFASLTPKGWLIIAFVTLVISAVTAVVLISDNRDKRMIETAQESGETKAVVEGQRDILNQVERANNAEQEIQRSGDAARYDRCLLDATDDTRANCERFRPVPD